MSKAAQARPPRLSARGGGQGFSLRRTREYVAQATPQFDADSAVQPS